MKNLVILILLAIIVGLVAGLGTQWFKQEPVEVKVQGAPKTEVAPKAETPVAAGASAASPVALKNFIKLPAPRDLPALKFVDAAGTQKDLVALQGKVTLLNLWATWCAPCRKEMPELSQLQKDMGGPDFQVVELSQDLKGYQVSADFLKSVGADNLTLYADDKAAAIDAIKAPGLPVTLLLNRRGQEVGRLLGPAAWASEEAKALIKATIDER